MHISRRNFLGGLGAAGAMGLTGCKCPFCCCGPKGKIALQLYSIHRYIGGIKNKDGKVVTPGVGLERALADVAKIGYKAVEFAGYYGFTGNQLKKMLGDNGLVACGTHVGLNAFGFDTKKWTIDEGVMKKTCEFNLAYGNNVIICPGGGNCPPGVKWSTGRGGDTTPPTKEVDDFTMRLADLYNKGAEIAGKYGCRIGLHNHTWEFGVMMTDGSTFWDKFFSNTDKTVLMEQDVGWTTCAGYDPKEQFKKYPGRSPALHAKENGMGKDVKEFDAILGQPGRPGATPVDWDGLIPVADATGVEWWVVECEKHFEDLSAITPSYAFLRAKGLN